MSEAAAFKATLQDASAFRNLVAAAVSTLEEAAFNVGDGGLSLRQMDRESTSLVEATIPPGVFEEYTVEAAGLLRLNVTELKRTLDKAARGEVLVLEADPEKERLYFRLREPGKRSSRRFELKTLEPYLEEVPSPVLDYRAETVIKVGPLLEAVRDADLVTEFVKVRAAPDLFEVYGEGDKGYTYNTWDRVADDIVKHNAEEEVETTFGASKLLGVISPCRAVAETVTVKLSRNQPIYLEYGMKRRGSTRINGVEDRPSLSYYLAPMVV